MTLAILAVVFIIIFKFNFLSLAVVVLLFSLLTGWQVGSKSQVDVKAFRALQGKNLSLTGQIQDDISKSKTGAEVIRLHKIKLGTHELAGSVLAMTRDSTDHLRRGDKIKLSGKLDSGIGGYVASMPNARIVSASAGTDIGVTWRDFLVDQIELALPEQSAHLVEAFLLGKRRMFTQKTVDNFTTTGLIHLLVASGFHLTTIAGFVKTNLAKKSRKAAVIGGLLCSLIFILMTGFSASMVRAGLVVLLSTVAWYYGRQFQALKLLMLVAGISLLINPLYLWGDAAWWLSFLSFFGVLIVAPIFSQFFYGDEQTGFIRSIVLTSISAQLAVLPISMLFFGRISLVAPLANLLVAPFVPLLMLLGVLIIIFQLIFAPLTSLIATPINLIIIYMTKVVDLLAEVPLASVGQTIDFKFAVIFYLIFGLILIFMNWLNIRQARLDSAEVL